MKKTLKIIRLVLLIALILIAVSTMLMQIPALQTWLGHKAAKYLSEKVDATISLGALKILPFNTVIVENLVVIDDNPCSFELDSLPERSRLILEKAYYRPVDTVLVAERLNLSFTLRGLAGRSTGLNRVVLKNATVNLVIEDKNPYPANISRMFAGATRKASPKGESENESVFYIRTVRTENVAFNMKNYRLDPGHDIDTNGINWNDLRVEQINIRGKNIRSQGKVLTGEVDFASFTESRIGYEVLSLSGRARVGDGLTLVEDFRLKDAWSDLAMNSYSMTYAAPKAFKYYLEQVEMSADLATPFEVDPRTLGVYAPKAVSIVRKIAGQGLIAVRGAAKGTVSDLHFSSLQLDAPKLEVTINGRLEGLPHLDELLADLSLTDIWAYQAGTEYSGNVAIKGSSQSAHLNLRADAGSGHVFANLHARNLLRAKKREVSGTVATRDLDLREIAAPFINIDKLPLGRVTLSTSIDAHLSPLSVQIDSAKIRKIELFNREFENARLSGLLSNGHFDGSLTVEDSKLELFYDGVLTLPSAQNSGIVYQCAVDVPYADLHSLGLDPREQSIASFSLLADAAHTDDDFLLGTIQVADFQVETAAETYHVGEVVIDAEPVEGEQGMWLDSDFLEAYLQGSGKVKDVLADIKNTILEDVFPKSDQRVELSSSGLLKLRTKKTADILGVLSPGKYIAEGTTVDLSLTQQGHLQAKVHSQRIASKTNFIKDLDIVVDNGNGSLVVDATAQDVRVASMDMFDGKLNAMTESGVVNISFSYDNQDEKGNKGELTLLGKIESATSIEAFFDQSYFTLGGHEWSILPSIISIENKVCSIDNFALYAENQSIAVNGKLSKELSDTLDVRFANCDISIANNLFSKKLDLGGRLSGLAKITSDGASRGVIADLKIHNATMAQEDLSDISVHSYWNSLNRRYDFDISNAQNLNLRIGYTIPTKYLEAKLKLNDFSLRSVAPFTASILSDLEGEVTGEIGLIGPIGDLNIRSLNTQFRNASARVVYTNVPYTINGPFHLNDSGLHFDNVAITDRFGNKGAITGKVGYRQLKEVNLDVDIDVNSVEIINLQRQEPFYGHLYGTGHVDITGPLNGVNLAANVTTSGLGEFHVPLQSQQNAGSTNLLKFKEEEKIIEVDPYDEMLTKLRKQKESANNFAMKLAVQTTPLVEVSVEVDKDNGNVLRGRGAGNFDISVKPGTGLFDITGDYQIDTGNYHFVLLGNLVARDFTINEGSSIRFNGDIMSSTLNIDATYKTKASLSSLISDTTSTSIRRTVECGIAITEKLSNPRLSFSINIPDLDPTINAQVESALSTDDKVQKQFLALLISNSFIPDEQSSIVNSNSTLFSNVSELMANQLNNIFQKLDIPLDLGLNYQQTDSGNDVFDVAVSTQLFNNRVVINGNIGNRQYHSTTSGSEIAGDLDVEIKLDRQGSFKLTLFSHSADAYTNYLDDSQRNGAGVSYQQEFNNFGQWVKRLFTPKSKRAAEISTRNQEMVEIKIEKQ